MKKVVSLILALALIASMFTVAASAYSVSDEGALSAKEVVAAAAEEAGEEIETQRIYFQMPNGKRGTTADKDVIVNKDVTDPETGEVIGQEEYVAIHAGEKAPTWYSDYNVVDGQHYAGAYWWGGTGAADSWCGYRMEIEDYDQGIYYVDIPTDVVIMIFNNGVDGGMDSSDPIYFEAAQTVDTNIEGAYEGDYDSLPYGSPDNDFFNDCIYIIDPNQVSINPLSQKQTCGANWYVYYGNGCYGEEYAPGGDNNDYPDGTPDWSDNVADICKNPDHFKNGVHVGYQGEDVHTHTLEKVDEVPATTEATGVKAHYKCTGCDKLFLDAEGTQEVTAEDLVIEKLPVFEPDPTKFYFDAKSTGWTLTSKTKIAFNIFGGDLENALDWGSKKLLGTAVSGQDGLFEFDPAAKAGYTFTPGVQYKIIFVQVESGVWGNQTYDLLFTADCLGHIGYCDGTQYENPVDSSKKTLAAFWKDMDPTQYGPVLQVSSIGNVVGTCPETGKTPESIFVDFLTVINEKTGTTMYANAYHFVVEPGTKTEQKLIDDIGTDLGLTKQQVYDAFTNNAIETAWDYTVSTLPGDVVIAHTHTPAEAVRENEKAATCTAAGSYDEVVYCSGCGEELSREPKTIAKLDHTPGDVVYENEVVGHDSTTRDAVVYCTVCHTELSREQVSEPIITHTLQYVKKVEATENSTGVKAHYKCTVCGKLFSDKAGKNEVTAESLIIPKLTHTHIPGDVVIENRVDASCTKAGSYDEVVYCTACGEELSRETKTIDKIAHTPADAARENEVAATCTADGSYDLVVRCSSCGTVLSSEHKTIDKIAHTPASAVKENIVASTCTAKGSYDAVVYCKVCHEELSRTKKTTSKKPHTLTHIDKVEPTETAEGMQEHYKCSVCEKLFSDAEGKNEVTAASLVIPKLTPTDKGILGDVDGDGEVTIIDVTIIQRILIGLIEPDDAMTLRADVDKVDGIDITDATWIQRYLLGIETGLPIGDSIK